MLGYLADGHRPVALIPVRSGRYQLVDPAAGTRTLLDGRASPASNSRHSPSTARFPTVR